MIFHTCQLRFYTTNCRKGVSRFPTTKNIRQQTKETLVNGEVCLIHVMNLTTGLLVVDFLLVNTLGMDERLTIWC